MSLQQTIGLLSILLLAGCNVGMYPKQQEHIDETDNSSIGNESYKTLEIVAQNMEIPWDIAFLPNGDILVTERKGQLVRIGQDDQQYEIDGVHHIGEGGLLGIALHPQFSENHWIYLYMTSVSDGALQNRVVRYEYRNNALENPTTIIDGIPGAKYHDGGRIAFGPNGYLYITTGDASKAALAQEKTSLAGKILRIHDDGSIPEDNPFRNAVYSYGHRNPQGITWDDEGNLWSTEHGRSGNASGYDELNRIEAGANYGWPIIQGDEIAENMQTPTLHSGTHTTWAPASAHYIDNSILFGGLRGKALYKANIEKNGISPSIETFFLQEFGRIRTVAQGNDGWIYITTSNTDGRGNPKNGDDKIVRIHPKALNIYTNDDDTHSPAESASHDTVVPEQ